MPIALRVRLATDVDPAALTLAFPDELIQVHVVHQLCIPFLALFDGGQANVCRLPPPADVGCWLGHPRHGSVPGSDSRRRGGWVRPSLVARAPAPPRRACAARESSRPAPGCQCPIVGPSSFFEICLQKTCGKVWQFKRKAYLCTRNRENNTGCRARAKRSLRIFT